MNTMISKVNLDSALEKTKRVCKSILPAVITIGAGFVCADAFANDGPPVEGALAEVKDSAKAVITLGLQLLLAAAFLMVSIGVIGKFNDARRGRADWIEVVVPFVVGAAVIVLIVYLQDAGMTAANEI